MKNLKYFLFLLIITTSLNSFLSTKFIFAQEDWEKQVELGIPKDKDDSDDFLIKRKQYVLSYNVDRNVANWVSWDLNKKSFGKAKRTKSFYTDPSLPKGSYKVKTKDYVGSGYDRGHMTRSECRTRTAKDNLGTFYLSNILPQTPDLNRKLWKGLEDYCNDLARKENKELFIICGGVYYNDNKIKNKIAIPDSCFKIIVIMEEGQGINDVTKDTPVIAVMMPNEDGITDLNWRDYLTTVNAVENSTKYNFLNNVPEEIQNKIETKRFK